MRKRRHRGREEEYEGEDGGGWEGRKENRKNWRREKGEGGGMKRENRSGKRG